MANKVSSGLQINRTMAAFLNNRFLPDAEAMLHISDLSMQRSYAIFDFFRTVNARPLFIEDHLNRFYKSAASLHMPVKQSREELKQIIHQLIEQSNLKEAGVRLMLTGGYSADSYHTAEPNLLITCNPVITSTKELFDKGITTITYEHQRELPHIKSINYLMAVWLHPFLKEKGADDVLYHQNNSITEFPRANVFVVTKENKLITPAQNILHGVTRKFVLQQAAAFMQTEERTVSIDELYNAAEVFLTSTTRRVMPVLKVDSVVIGDGKPGPVAQQLWQRFMHMEEKMQ
jgi:branched-chain amino acid aminotransferase